MRAIDDGYGIDLHISEPLDSLERRVFPASERSPLQQTLAIESNSPELCQRDQSGLAFGHNPVRIAKHSKKVHDAQNYRSDRNTLLRP